MNDATAAALLELRREVAELRALVVLRRPLARADHDVLVRLLPAIVATVGDAAWTLPDLAELALLPAHEALARELAAALNGRATLRALGKLLARGAGHDVNGLRLVACGGADRRGALWCVRI